MEPLEWMQAASACVRGAGPVTIGIQHRLWKLFFCVWESLDREGERTAERGRRGLGNRAWPFRWGLGAAGRETGDLQLALQLAAGATSNLL